MEYGERVSQVPPNLVKDRAGAHKEQNRTFAVLGD